MKRLSYVLTMTTFSFLVCFIAGCGCGKKEEPTTTEISEDTYNQIYNQVYQQIYNEVSSETQDEMYNKIYNEIYEKLYQEFTEGKTLQEQNTTINLNKYLIGGYEGYDGEGEADISFDYYWLLEEYIGIFKSYDRKDIEELISINVSKEENLCNGDEIQITWRINEEELATRFSVVVEYADYVIPVTSLKELTKIDAFEGLEIVLNGVSGYATASLSAKSHSEYTQYKYEMEKKTKLVNGDEIVVRLAEGAENAYEYKGIAPIANEKVFVVEGLEEVKTFDAFENIKVTFSGDSPYGKASIDYRAAKYNELSYTFDKNSGLKNGDIVTVYISSDSINKCAARYEEIPSVDKMTYVVEGLPEIVMDDQTVSADKWKEMSDYWKQYVENTVPVEWEKPESLTNVKYIGYTFSYPTMEAWSDDYYVSFLFELTVDSLQTEEFKYYYYIEIKNLKKTGDGEYTFDEFYVPYGYYSKWFGTEGNIFMKDDLYYVGFETYDLIYENRVLNDRSSYNTKIVFAGDYSEE